MEQLEQRRHYNVRLRITVDTVELELRTFDGFIFLFPGRVEDGKVAANGRCVHEFSINHAFPSRKKGFYQIFPVKICYHCLLNKIFVAGAILTIVNIVRDIDRIWFINCPIGSCKLLNLSKT